MGIDFKLFWLTLHKFTLLSVNLLILPMLNLNDILPAVPDRCFSTGYVCYSYFGCVKSQDRERPIFYWNCMKTEQGKRQ